MTNPKKEIENLLEKIYATYAPQIRPFEILTDHTEVTIQALKASNRGDSETEEIIDACSDKIHKLAQAYAQLFYSVGGLTLKKDGETPPPIPTNEDLEMLKDHPKS